jgi:hypothetical protein
MAEKTKLQIQIEASEKKIQEERNRLKSLERKQTERDRKDRNHRLCKRHGYLESILPCTVNLTDEQFQDFVKQHIANRHGIASLAKLTGQTQEAITAAANDAKLKKDSTSTHTAAENNNEKQSSKSTTQNATNLANTQGATA